MRFRTLIKLAAGAMVLSTAVFTGLLVWHVRNEPLGGVFTRLVPVRFEPQPVDSLLDTGGDVPEVDPGSNVFEKAREFIAVGDLPAAKERLKNIIGIYPRSKAAPEARRIVGEMNLDDILSATRMDGKAIHIVRPGESFLGIATKYGTTLDSIMHLNGLMDLKSLHPGEELVIMPLEFRVLIDPAKKTLSLWKEGEFIKEYQLAASDPGTLKAGLHTKITSRSASFGGRSVSYGMKEYRESDKVFSLDKTSLQLRGIREKPSTGDDAEPPRTPGPGFLLHPEDAEELTLLLRPGNEVEIRPTSP